MIGVGTSNAGSSHTLHPDAQWFGDAGLGLFVHWGISSVYGKIDLSWGMQANTPWDSDASNAIKPTPADYFKLAERFKPDQYHPERWLATAARAGFAYAVLTTKHHDGYTLWPSDTGEFGVRQFLPGRDLVQPFVDACRILGLKVGLYYSPPDWYFRRHYMSFNFGSDNPKEFPGRKHFGLNHEPLDDLPTSPPGFEESFQLHVRNQVIELCTRYGKIDLLWFDGVPNVISLDEIRVYQPGIVINPRMHGKADFESPECAAPKQRPSGWWERCDQWNIGGWGYAGEDYWPTAGMLTTLAVTRAWGGNLLMNCGPRPSGEMPDMYYTRMEELTAWMKHSGESVLGTVGGPWPERCNVPVTLKEKRAYLHFTERKQEPAIMRNVDRPVRVTLLRTGDALGFAYGDRVLSVVLPTSMMTALDDVVRVEWA